MRFPPLLLACALVACASGGKTASSEGTAAVQAVTPGAGLAPASFVRTTADAPAIRSIEVRDGLSRQTAMRSLNELLSQRYVVDVVDPRAGFAMTTWQASLVREGVPDPRYRTRFVARFVDEWKSLQLRSEARFTRGQEPDVGYDSAQLDSLANDVRTKLGKKP
ncbi:MAG TPA: hypothetical protein VJT85_00715 [Gemmatimonadaceae bacterium]|nr:hypothetical protein [Gemmatimonadaceae bacterium]